MHYTVGNVLNFLKSKISPCLHFNQVWNFLPWIKSSVFTSDLYVLLTCRIRRRNVYPYNNFPLRGNKQIPEVDRSLSLAYSGFSFRYGSSFYKLNARTRDSIFTYVFTPNSKGPLKTRNNCSETLINVIVSFLRELCFYNYCTCTRKPVNGLLHIPCHVVELLTQISFVCLLVWKNILSQIQFLAFIFI